MNQIRMLYLNSTKIQIFCSKSMRHSKHRFKIELSQPKHYAQSGGVLAGAQKVYF